MLTLIGLFMTSMLASLLLTPKVRFLAGRLGLVDKPDQRRKLQGAAIPIGGGIAILAASLFSLLAMLISGQCPWIEDFEAANRVWSGLVLASVIICAVGLLDDAGRIRGRHKLLGQVAAVSVLVCSGLVVRTCRIGGWEIDLGMMAIPFTAFFLLGSINSLNLLDGMDGLLSSVALIICVAFTAMAAMGEKWATACVAVTLAGALLGFLRYNFPPASIYLGDTGSMLIGLVVGALAIKSSLKGPATIAFAAPVAVMVIPILDTTAAIFRRKLTGRSLYTTDRGHLHHCLLRMGFCKVTVLVLVSTLCFVAAAGAYLSITLNSEWLAVIGSSIVAVFLVSMRWFGHGELNLVADRVKSTVRLMLANSKSAAQHSSVRIQGCGPWAESWSTLVKFAEAMSLRTLNLDINAPALHEAYHGQWSQPAGDDADSNAKVWNASFPLVWRDQTVGRLQASGLRDQRAAWMKIARLVKMVDELEGTLRRIAEGTVIPGSEAIETAMEPDADSAPIRKLNRLQRRYQRLIDLNLSELRASAESNRGSDPCEPNRSRVLVFNRSYHPDVEATGQLLTELCSDLARDRDVHVITGMPNFVAVEGRRLLQTDFHLGVEVTRVRNIRFTKKSMIGRAFGLLTYMLLAFWAGLRSRRPQVIIVETDPPFLGLMGAILAHWHGCPLIYYVQDLYPEVGLALGRLRPGVVTRLLHWSTQIGLRAANRVIVLGEDMRSKILARGIPMQKITIVSNWADTELIRPKSVVARPNIVDAETKPLTVMYSGNLGLSQNLDSLLDAARELQAQPVRFVLIGEGAAKPGLEARANEWRLENVSFLPYCPKVELGDSLASADVHLIPLRRGLAGAIVPSKLYGIMAAGVPFIAAVDADSEVARVAETTGAGLLIEPDSAPDLVNAIRWCFENRAQLAAMGLRGREEAETRFSRPVCVRKIDRVIASVAGEDTREEQVVATLLASSP
jgi:UDP-GlcNAc:undecaprenyl-phosphate/decaprenyl-phosphate GlcNAc-1-phosphate transferase